MVVGMLGGSDSGVAFYFSYHPNTRVPASSLLRSEEATDLLVSEAPRSELGAFRSRSADLLVAPGVDRPFAMLPLSVAMFLPVVFGLGRILHFAVLNNCRLSEDRTQSAPERPSKVR